MSSPTISTAEVSSSVPPGGRTGPRARSLSLSNPCLGTGVAAGFAAALIRLGVAWDGVVALTPRVLGAARLALAGAFAARGAGFAAAVLSALAAGFDWVFWTGLAREPGWAALRAASRRGLERWGLVRGSWESTPVSAAAAAAPPLLFADSVGSASLSLGALISHIIA